MKNRNIMFATIFLALGLLAFSQVAQAVVPPPDGGYPGGNTAEGQSALLSRTTGGFNAAAGFLSLRSLTTGSFNTGVGAGTLVLNTADQNTAAGAGALLNYAPLPAARGDFLFRAGRLAEARLEFEAAATLTRNARERTFLLTRADACDGND